MDEININSIKNGFETYLRNSNKTDEKQIDVSIFSNAQEFQNYLEDELNLNLLDISERTSWDKLKDYKLVDGQLVQKKNDEAPQEDALVANVMNILLQDSNFIYAIDKNGNGEITLSDLKNFIKTAEKQDGQKSNLSLQDIFATILKMPSATTKPQEEDLTTITLSDDKIDNLITNFLAEKNITKTAAQPSVENIVPRKDTVTKETLSKTEQIDYKLAEKIDKKLGSGFCAKVENIAKNINCNPNDLLAIMYTESGLNPSKKAEKGSATGLIQFLESTANNLGTTTSKLAGMDGISQLDYVEKFYQANIEWIFGSNYTGEIDSGTLYALTFLPQYAKQEILCDSSTEAYQYNTLLDENKDGNISKSDLADVMDRMFDDLLKDYGLS